MSKSEKRPERFVITWVAVLFVFSLAISLLLAGHRNEVIIGLVIGTIASVAKFVLNSRNFDRVLTNEAPNVFGLVLFNMFTLGLLFLAIYILLSKLNAINLYTAIGLALGVSFVPLVILGGGILQSLYIIRNKF